MTLVERSRQELTRLRHWLYPKPLPVTPVNPRYRALGKARLDIARQVKDQNDWDRLWKPPVHPFPFEWGEGWKQCIEYRVKDFAAEVGFLIDVLGLTVNALGVDYAQFTSPDGAFYIALTPTPPDETSTPPESIRLQFMLADLMDVYARLQARRILFEHSPQPIAEGSDLYVASFRTPHGIRMELWGYVSIIPEVDQSTLDHWPDFPNQGSDDFDGNESSRNAQIENLPDDQSRI